MFFWVQNGLLTPRTPEVSRQTVTPVMNLTEIHKTLPFDAETESQQGTNNRIFQNPRAAYEDNPTERELPSPLLFASQIMSKPVTTLYEDEVIAEAKYLFLKRRFRHIPIIDRKERICGILSDRDVLKSVADDSNFMEEKVSQIMQEKVLTGNLQTEIRYAAKVMLEERVGSLPIVDQNGEVLGIITRTDLIRAIVKFPGFTLLA